MTIVVRAIVLALLTTPFLTAQVNPISLMPIPENQRGLHSTFHKTVGTVGRTKFVAGSQSYTYAVPLFHIPGRAGQDLDLTLTYNSQVWSSMGGSIGGVWGLNLDLDVPSPGFRLDYGMVEVSEPQQNFVCAGAPAGTPAAIVLIDADGSKHNLVPGANGCTTEIWQSDDSTYIQIHHDVNNQTETITYRDGHVVTLQNYVGTGLPGIFYFRPTQITDTNGNSISITYAVPAATAVDTSISTVTDAAGRTITFFYNVGNGQISSTGVGQLACVTDGVSCGASGSRTFTFSWNENYICHYNFNVISGVGPPTNFPLPVLVGVGRPDGTSVQFNYGDWEIVNDIKEFSNTGQRRYEVSYNFPPATIQQNSNPTYTTQTIFDGVNTETWNYAVVTNSKFLVGSYAVTDPMGTTTTSTFSTNGDWQDGLLIQQQVTGCSPAPCGSGRRTFKTVNVAWTSDNGSSGSNPRPTSVTTTLDDGSQSQVAYVAYDANGNVTDMKESDLGAGAPGPTLRETLAKYASLGSILNKPSDVKVEDGNGNILAHSALSYDSHGNLIGTTSYANAAQNTGGINSSYTYDQYGNRLTAAEGGNSKESVYSSATNFTYPDSITVGPSGNSASLTTSFTYNIGTGTVATVTDPNGQTTSYGYDLDNRLTSTTTPDRVTVSTVYDDSDSLPAVTTSNSADSLVVTNTTDFLGHSLTTQKLNGSTTVSTITSVNDALGRPSQTSNPYGPSDTPEYTTYLYDALGRTISTTPPVLAGVSQQSPYSASYTGATVTFTDPALKQHKQYFDGLSRLVRVDEPGGSNAGAVSSGTVPINGALQIYATSGTGTVTIGGAERSKTTNPCVVVHRSCPVTIYDSGAVSVTVNGVQSSTTYGQGSNSTAIASNLASAVNGNNSYVHATSSGPVVTITAVTSGTGTNYSLSASKSTNDPTDFPGGSFSTSTSGSTLTGGAGPVTDSGTVALILDGYSATASYGSGQDSTASAVAADLAAQLTAKGPPFTINAAGSNLSIVWKTQSSSGNVAVSCGSATNQGSYFSNPSFTCSNTNLTGGQDPGGGSLSTPNTTQYAYDPMGDLLTVTQGQQTRSYGYDSVGRMTSSAIPESGNAATTFTYEDFGAVATRVDPRGITTTYGYDALNRLSTVQYSNGTATDNYTYGGAGAPNFGAGRLVSTSNANASETYQYDNMGRLTQCTKTIGGNLYTTNFSYNADGTLNTITYPSNRAVTNSYDAIGRLTKVSSGGTDFLTINSYNAAGQVLTSLYGNGMQGTYTYNNQMQMASILAENSAPILSLTYNYGGAQDNGQIQGITDNVTASRSTAYSYDALSRLAAAQTQDLTSPGTWSYQYAYDRYGNRLSQIPGAGTAPMNMSQLMFDPTTNHVTSAGFNYDADGNMTSDAVNNYTFDGANRLSTSTPIGGGNTATYYYDTNGQRINKNGSYYIFNSGKVIAEYANGALAGSPSAEYVYAGGQRVANIISGATTYNYWDHLSIRVNADSSGNVIRNSTHFPFGESTQDTGGVSSLLTKWKFTTYERDSESGLDYAMARHYGSAMGRFMSLDPVAADITDPQTHNRYSYAGNDPINRMDPTGMDDCFTDCGPGEGGDGGLGGLGDALGVSWPDDWGAIFLPPFPTGSLNGLGMNPGAMGILTDDWQIPIRSLADTLRSLLPWNKPCDVYVMWDCAGPTSFTSNAPATVWPFGPNSCDFSLDGSTYIPGCGDFLDRLAQYRGSPQAACIKDANSRFVQASAADSRMMRDNFEDVLKNSAPVLPSKPSQLLPFIEYPFTKPWEIANGALKDTFWHWADDEWNNNINYNARINYCQMLWDGMH